MAIDCGHRRFVISYQDYTPTLTRARAQLTTMMETKQKAEIQALSSFGFQYISTDYLPRKLREGDWV